jgi:hypothetical protein
MSACLAMLLNLEVDDVPPFMKYFGGRFWDRACNMWLEHNFGYWLLCIQMAKKVETGDDFRITNDAPPYNYCIGSGKSPRGDWHHAIVGKLVGLNFEKLYDPHPDDKGIETVEYLYFLVPCNPIMGAKGNTVCTP